jgi:bifunctional UDP-N-acetylglucosamine pyrophosphorylase / glucosamine-1-phosphate N-acetyltransferase
VGSNSVLIAPVLIENGAFIGAGSTITKGVAKGQLSISRVKQSNINNWKRPQKRKQ